MDKCQCSLSIRLTGDGCRYCQPQLYIDRLEEWLDEARKERDELQDGLAKCRDAFDSTSITDVEIEGLWAQAIGNPSDVAQYVEAMVKAQQWQSIDTAPKDGTWIIALCQGRAIEARWGEIKYPETKWRWEGLHMDFHGCDCCACEMDEPTHWMPLPKPPKE